MKKHLLLAAASTFPAHAAVVSWNYDDTGTVSGTNAAGVVLVANWNNSFPTNPTINLIDSTGTATTLDLAYGSFNNFHIQGSHPGVDGDGSYNKELLNGYLNAGPAAWSPAVTSSFVTLSQIPYANYDVIVYFSSDGAGREGQVNDGTTTYYFNTIGAPSTAGANATLTQTTSTTTANYATANYAVFTGLTGSTRTFTVQMRDNDEWAGIAGFQVVSVPEPASAALGSLALIGLTLRRRRMD
ncbi:MAG: PEP-CTERM sorting domain-containing protein [Verrucomicrobiota bacterium]